MNANDEKLPGVLGDIEAAAGRAAALRMAHEFGGITIYIPERAGPNSPLMRAVGPEAAETIIALLGRGPLTVPLGPCATHRRVRDAVRSQLSDGKPVSKIARAVGCHERTVKRERKRQRAAEGMPLFDHRN